MCFNSHYTGGVDVSGQQLFDIQPYSSVVYLICQAHGHVLGKLGAGLQDYSPQLPTSQPALFKPPKPPCAAESDEKDVTPSVAPQRRHVGMHMHPALQLHESAQLLHPLVNLPT